MKMFRKRAEKILHAKAQKVLLDAADLLETHGWAKGTLYTTRYVSGYNPTYDISESGYKDAYCATGAISQAACPFTSPYDLVGDPNNIAHQALLMTRKLLLPVVIERLSILDRSSIRVGDPGWTLVFYNDQIAQNKEEVIDLLRKAALL